MARKLDFFDGSTSGTTPTIGDIQAANLLTFANDAAYEAANAGAPTAGNLYYNTTIDKIRYYDDNAAAWKTLPDEAASSIVVTPTGNLTSSDAQAALEELQGDIDTNTTNIGTNTTNIGTNTTDIGTNDTDITNLQNDKIETSTKGAANGVAELDAGGKVPITQIPATAITSVDVVASEAAQIALTAEEGDVAKRTDEGIAYIHNGGTAGDITDWTILHDAFAGANDTLSNLTSPTSVSQALIPSASHDIGSNSDRWGILFTNEVRVGNNEVVIDNNDSNSPSGTTDNTISSRTEGEGLIIYSENTTGGTNAGDLRLESGNSVNGAAGDIIVRTGLESGAGTDGKLFVDIPTKGTNGDVLTQTGVLGETIWATPAGGGGDAWSDPVDANIVPDVSASRDVGSTAKFFDRMFANQFRVALTGIVDLESSPSGAGSAIVLRPASIATANQVGVMSPNNNVANASNTVDVFLESGNIIQGGASGDTGDIRIRPGTNAGSGNRGTIDMTAAEVTNLAEPTASGSAATKNYVDTNSGDAWSDAVDSDIIPDGDGTRDLGNASTAFGEIHAKTRVELNGVATFFNSLSSPSGTTAATIVSEASTPVGMWSNNTAALGVNTGEAMLQSGNLSGTGSSGDTGDVHLRSGKITNGSGKTGDVIITAEVVLTGGGTQGSILLNGAAIEHNQVVSNELVVTNGATGSRPGSPITGQIFFDTTIGHLISFDGTNWVDGVGTTV